MNMHWRITALVLRKIEGFSGGRMATDTNYTRIRIAKKHGISLRFP